MSFSGVRTRLGDEAAAVSRFVWRLGIRPRLRRREGLLLLVVGLTLLVGWTSLETLVAPGGSITLPYPMGSEDNRRENVAAERNRLLQLTVDRQLLIGIVGWTHWSKLPGTRVAHPANGCIKIGAVP